MSPRRRLAVFVLLALLTTSSALAESPPLNLHRSLGEATIHGGGTNPAAKAARDTFLLMGPTGSGAPHVGDFELGGKALDPAGPGVHGWTSIDYTYRGDTHWQVSDYQAVNGSYSAWCGSLDYPSCEVGIDPDGGYGNGWNELLEFRGTVADNGVTTTLNITAIANIDSEAGYDGTTLRAEKYNLGFIDLAYWDGLSSGLAISETVTYLPGEYMGTGGDEVVLIWRFVSDSIWSDEDCLFPTGGGIQLDDVTITSDNGVSTGGTVDFEDQTFGPLATRLPRSVGDFAHIWSYLEDHDPCITNYTRQVAFIDDGMVVPGTGGAPCQDWCYGPMGFIVNTTGGLAGPENHIHNAVRSPVMSWPDPGHAGALFTYSVWRHEDLSADSPGMFYTWGVRSIDTGNPADIESAEWRSRNFVYYGGPDYRRDQLIVDDLLVVAPTHVQVELAVYEMGWVWGWTGNDGTPAPYYDNVRFETYEVVGPAMATREIDLAQDNFPASGTIDMSDPGALSVRFDGTQDISPSSHLNPSVADSICIDVAMTRADAVLDSAPTLHYKVEVNPLFDPYRTSAMPMEGAVPCEGVIGLGGLPVDGRYFGDLDDEGFLFPGDVVHYYFSATGRDTTDGSLETSILPADTSGFDVFDDPMAYDPSFTVHCLPTITHEAGYQPGILFWNDFGNRGGRDEWHTSLRELSAVRGRTYDLYYTNGPSSGVGNGLGGRATALQLANYETVIYTSGDLSVTTLSNGDLDRDSGADVELLMNWLDSGSKWLFATGDDLASSLDGSGVLADRLLSDYFRVAVNDHDIRPLIGGQTTPRILPTNDHWLINRVGSWIAYGGCPGINTFDAVTTLGGAARIAVWTDASGIDPGYPYSAATFSPDVGYSATSTVASLPYDLAHIYTDPNEPVPPGNTILAARTRILDVLGRINGFIDGTELPTVDVFAASHHPNPFNPQVNLEFTIARPGRLTVKVYDVRGRLVRSLFDEQVTTKAELAWYGKDDRGADTASGVYFYEARMHGEVRIGKVTLVR